MHYIIHKVKSKWFRDVNGKPQAAGLAEDIGEKPVTFHQTKISQQNTRSVICEKISQQTGLTQQVMSPHINS